MYSVDIAIKLFAERELEVLQMTEKSKSVNTLIVTYLTLRKVIGALGISLPFIVSIGAFLIFNEGQGQEKQCGKNDINSPYQFFCT